MIKIILLLQLACIFSSARGKIQLSSLIPTCSAKDPNLNECVRESAQKFIPILSKGIKDYAIPPMDPLRIPKMEIGEKTGPVTLTITYLDALQTGWTNNKVDKAEVDLSKGRIVLNTTHPWTSLVGKYKANGRILVLPVQGDGDFNATQKNNKCDVVIEGHPQEVKGNVYFKVDKFRIYWTFGKSYLDYANLFNGNKELGESTNKFLNDNAGEVFLGLRNALQDVYSELFGGLFRRLFDSVPYNQLFKDV